MSKKPLPTKYLASLWFVAFWSSFCFGYEYKSLIDLTTACFKNCPEYCGYGDKNDVAATIFLNETIIKNDLFATLQEFAEQEKKQLCNSALWPKNTSPFAEAEAQNLFKLADFFPKVQNFEYASKDPIYPFMQYIALPNTAEICIIGDIHGAIHGLLRSLWRLVVLGKLNTDFTIADKNFFMFFLGDYADRGYYGLEVWYTILRLKNTNRGRVFLLRGNHELPCFSEYPQIRGLAAINGELMRKNVLKSNYAEIRTKLYNVFELLPVALVVPTNYLPIQFAHAVALDADEVKAACLSETTFSSLKKTNSSRLMDRINFEGGELKKDKQTFTDAKASILCHGHDHSYFGLKLFTKNDSFSPILNHYKTKYMALSKDFDSVADYTDGLYWKDALMWDFTNKKALTTPPAHVIKIQESSQNIYPIFTLSTSSADLLRVPYDCFCILKLADLSLQVFEVPLDNTARNGSYVSLELSPDQALEIIKPVFTEKKPRPDNEIIDPEILKKVSKFDPAALKICLENFSKSLAGLCPK